MKIRIGVIGFGGEDKALNDLAFKVGREIAARGCFLICGGLEGVMRSACEGAKDRNGITIGILPGKDQNEANKYVDIPVVTNMGEARNIIVVRTSDVLIAIGGGFGTLSEISFALKLGIPVIGLDTWDVSDEITKVENASDAVEAALEKTGKASGI